MGTLFGILFIILVADAIIGVIAFIFYEKSRDEIWCTIASVCGIIFIILLFAILILALSTSDTKVGTGR